MKHCKKCRIKQHLEDFNLAENNRDGRSGTCRTCYNKHRSEKRKKAKTPKVTQNRIQHGDPVVNQMMRGWYGRRLLKELEFDE